jgi:hypothetical protein
LALVALQAVIICDPIWVFLAEVLPVGVVHLVACNAIVIDPNVVVCKVLAVWALIKVPFHTRYFSQVSGRRYNLGVAVAVASAGAASAARDSAEEGEGNQLEAGIVARGRHEGGW